MKHKLRFLLAIGIGLMTSIGWLHAENDGYTKDGGNNYTVSTAEGLQNVLKELNKASSEITSTITLDADLDISSLKVMGGNGAKGDFQGMFFLDAPLNKNVTLTLDGGAGQHKIYGSNTIQGTAGSNKGEAIADYATKTYVFYVHNGSKTLTFKNLKIEDTNIVGFNFFGMTNIVFENVVVSNNEQGGIHLNSSNLTATKLSTSGNGKFAVKLSRETANIPSIVLNEGCTFAETTVPQVGFYDRYAYKDKFGEQTPATPTEDEFKAMVSGTVGSTMAQTWMAADLHTSNNTYSVRAWTNLKSDLSIEKYSANGKYVFANGKPITIEGIAGNKVKISLSGSDYVELPESDNLIVFGGSKDKSVSSSSVTMKSGIVTRLYGGGYGTTKDNSANVNGISILTVTGGTVKTSAFGGGKYYAHSQNVEINISGENTFIGDPKETGNYWLICGGDENGKTSGSNYVEFDQSNNTVESATLNINGGTYSLIALGGTDGAKGYIKNVTADIKNATITGGIYGNGSNGRSDEVVGTLTVRSQNQTLQLK